nr:rRNA pseudouridine synthase [Anaerolineae bacterium]
MPEERLQKLMAHAGIASRRECERIIAQNRVTVNGSVAQVGDKADPEVDEIRVDGQVLSTPENFEYIVLNKPRDYISDVDVGGNLPSARDLIPVSTRLYPVGRLDVPSEGLMLFTDDGDLTHKLTHPRYGHTRVYHVLVEGMPTEEALTRWREGFYLDGKRTLRTKVVRSRTENGSTWLIISMKEGRKRQIRRAASTMGYPVRRLIRVQLGPIELGDLRPGSWRRLTAEEIARLKSISAGRDGSGKRQKANRR